MKKLLLVTLVAVIAWGLAGDAFAGWNPYANLAIDLQARAIKRACPITYASCASINWIRANPAPCDAMVVVYGYNRFTAVEFGLSWNAYQLAFVAYKKCSDLIIEGGTPSQGTYSASQTWGTCQFATNPYPGESGVAVGWVQFDVYGGAGAGAIYIVPSAGGFMKIVDCDFVADDFRVVHPAFLGGVQPDSILQHPCEMIRTATQATTWSGVRALYR